MPPCPSRLYPSLALPLLLCACISVQAGAPEPAPVPWESQPFSLSPEALRRAAASMAAHPEYPCSVLLEAETVTLDATGRRHRQDYRVYRVEQTASLGHWGNVEAQWNAWFEARPTVRARVVTPDGIEHVVDPATLTEYQSQQADADVFSDRKEIKAPLPLLVAGALVEVEITRLETRPFSTAGCRGSFWFASPVPVQAYRYALDAPTGTPVEWKVDLVPGDRLLHTAAGGRTVHTLAMGPTLPPPPQEPWEDPDQCGLPRVQYATTRDWNAAAAEYSEIVSTQLKGADLRETVRHARGPARGQQAIIEAILAYVQKRVRYVALEFGDASIVPRTPAEVLRRGYGDCKDKSCLVVALLGAAGIEARVALLSVGTPWDVDAAMPGLGVFDHAIVYVPGPTPVWIDPAVRHARAGVLPTADQSRLALVVAPDTRELIRTPVLGSDQNLTRRTTHVYLAPDGPARVVETLEASGPDEIGWRASYGSADPQKQREVNLRYAVRTFRAKDLGTLKVRDTEDLSGPFQITMEVLEAGIASTSAREAWVLMNPGLLLSDFNEVMQVPPAQGAREAGSAPDPSEAGTRSPDEGADVPRHRNLLLRQPGAMERRWIIHVPEGYVIGTLPADATMPFGSARLSYVHARGEGNTVEVRQRFQWDQRLWKPAEVMQVRKAIRAFSRERIPLIVFQQAGEAHLAAGRLKEALDEGRKAAGRAPTEVAPLLRLARTQLAAGLGEEARLTAQRALALGPASAQAWSTQAWILQHDGLGRRFEEGWDRQGALDAYGKVLALLPDNCGARWSRATVLERAGDGQLRAPDQDTNAALDLYLAAAKEGHEDGLDGSLMQGLAAHGRFEEAHALAMSHQGTPFWDGWLVATAVSARGLQGGLEEACQIFQKPESRRQALVAAGDVLVGLRRYPEAAEVLNQGALGAESQSQVRARAENLARVRRQEPLAAAKDPREAPLMYLQRLFEGSPNLARISECFTLAQRPSLDMDALLQVRKNLLERAFGQSPQVAMDLLRSRCEFTVEGDRAHGWKVQMQSPYYTQIFMVIQEEGSLRLVSSWLNEAAFARQARWCLDRQDLGGASLWLGRAQERCWSSSSKDPFWNHPVFRIRSSGQDKSVPNLRLAIATVLAFSQADDKTVNVLEESYRLPLASVLHCTIGQALAAARRGRGEGEAAVAILASLLLQQPDSDTLRQTQINLLADARRWQELLALADNRLNTDSELKARTRLKALVHLRRGGEAEESFRAMTNLGKAHWQDYLAMAMAQAEEGAVTATTLEWARKGLLTGGDRSCDAELTLALVLAELGRTAEARETLLKARELDPSQRLRPQAWYVLGRIAEQLGELHAARTCLARARPEAFNPFMETAGFLVLARTRLLELDAAPQAKTAHPAKR